MQHTHGHDEPTQTLNETELLLLNGPDLLSYIVHDLWPDVDRGSVPWPSLMVAHVVALSLAFFVLLPISISLRSVKHPWHRATLLAFSVMVGFGVFSATLYRKVTLNLYEGSTHGRTGYALIAIVACLAIAEALGLIRRIVFLFVSTPASHWSLGALKRVIFNAEHDDLPTSAPEYAGLVQEVDDLHEETLEARSAAHHGVTHIPMSINTHSRASSFSPTGSEDLEHATTARWIQGQALPYNLAANHSDLTLHDSASTPTFMKHFVLPGTKTSLRARLPMAGNIIFHIVEHALVPFAFAEAVQGITVYTGACRGTYLNGCLAHLVKGGIFWCYGLVSFARYLGAWNKLGWAWNRRSDSAPSWTPSAEMVESSVIFLYGASNTWMERFGAAPGDPYTTKQVQHISIAVMFWFAGLVGIAIESRTIRRWLSQRPSSSAGHPDAATEQPFDGPSFNPLPGLVIGVTGLAMSAHHQAYVFLVHIHTLWGTMLAAFSAFRWLTYFMLWTKNRTGRSPMASSEPSRPPTEVLASFFLTCGGLVFILSMEEVGFAAMRAGHADAMMFLNLAVAVTCLAFAWLVGIMAVNGYVKTQHATALAARHPQLRRL